MQGIDAVDLIINDWPIPKKILDPWLLLPSMNLLYAPRGVGKTFFALAIAHAVATGNEFLGKSYEKPLRVALFDGEMGKAALATRLELMDNSARTSIKRGYLSIISFEDCGDTGRIWNISDPQEQLYYNEVVKEHDLIIIDNLLTCSFSLDNKDNEFEQWQRIQAWGNKWRSEGKALLFLHHSGKNRSSQLGTSTREVLLNTSVFLEEIRLPFAGTACQMFFKKHRDFHGEDTKPLFVHFETKGSDIVWGYGDLLEEVKPFLRVLYFEKGIRTAALASRQTLIDEWICQEVFNSFNQEKDNCYERGNDF